MEDLLLKLKEYLAMDHELPFEPFQQFYHDLMRELSDGFETMSHESRIQGRYICQIVEKNARARGRQNRALGKKFRKIADKCKFWAEAIEYRLKKEGLSQADINTMNEYVEKSIETVDNPVESVDNLSEPLEKLSKIGEKANEPENEADRFPGPSGDDVDKSAKSVENVLKEL